MPPDEEERSNGFDSDALAAFVERIENLQGEIDAIMLHAREECEPLRQDMAAVRREAQDSGIGKKEFSTVIRKRRFEYRAQHCGDTLDLAERANFEEMLASLEKLAEQVGPLGEAARDRARAAAAA